MKKIIKDFGSQLIQNMKVISMMLWAAKKKNYFEICLNTKKNQSIQLKQKKHFTEIRSDRYGYLQDAGHYIIKSDTGTGKITI